jgi:membrane dipeptidase
MQIPKLASFAFCAAALFAACAGRAPETAAQRVARVLRETPLVDGHNDMPGQIAERVANQLERLNLASGTGAMQPPMHTDIPRLRRGQVGGVFFAAFASPKLPGPEALTRVLGQVDAVRRLPERYPDAFALATTADDVVRAHGSGRVACLIGIEGGYALADSLAALRLAHLAGVRYVTLTHWNSTSWADAATDAPRHGGLSPFGVEMVREMNRLGVLVDLSHVSDDTMNDALDASEAPVVFSHSSARAVCNHVRNVPDAVLRRVRANGGVVMVNFAPAFVSEAVRVAEAPTEAEWQRLQALYPGDRERIEAAVAAFRRDHPVPRATLAQVADHVDHVRDVAGIDHVGIGSDFDGIGETPDGLEDVSRFPALLVELAGRGYTDIELAKVAGGNILRVLRAAESVAARLQRDRRAAEARIELLQPAAPATPVASR